MGRCLACTLVHVMQTAENWLRVDPADYGANGGPRRLDHQTSVGTFRVVVPHELSEHRPEMLLAENDHMVEALVAQSPDDPLRNRIRTGRSYRAGMPRR